MTRRWRGRAPGLAILALLLLVPLAASAGGGTDEVLVLRGPDGSVVARVPLPDGAFSLRYRNSVYGSTAEEHYTLGPGGTIELAGLAADELAVLEEYYAIDEPARRSADGPRTWVADPARPIVLDALIVAATDLGRRTLLVDGMPPLELWRLVRDESPSIELRAAGR
jgi:hypothetical protein